MRKDSCPNCAKASCSAAAQPNAMGPDGRLVQAPFPQAVRTTVHVDSRDRGFQTYPSSSSFVVKLPERLKNVTGAVLVSAELPLSYYVFSASRANTSLVVRFQGLTQTVTIPDGNYTSATMCAALKSALEAAFAGTTFTVTISSTTSLCTIAASQPGLAVDTRGATRDTEWGLGYYLGFAPGLLLGDGTASVTGTRVTNLNPETYLLLDIVELNGVNQAAMYGNGGGGLRTFAKVPLCGRSYSYSFYDCALTPVDRRPQLSTLEQLTVSIRFHDGTLVNLNGGEWSMSIEFFRALTQMP